MTTKTKTVADVPEIKKRKRRKKSLRMPKALRKVDHFYCTKCEKDHYKALTKSKTRYIKHWTLYRQKDASKLAAKVAPQVVALPDVSFEGKTVVLDTEKRSDAALAVDRFLKQRVVSQDHAVESFTNLIANVDADLSDPFKPRGIYLLMGPTGVGKTRIVEALSEYYFGSRNKLVKVNCGEVATGGSFEKFAEMIFGSQNVMLTTKSGKTLGLLLLDEIEKASRLVYKLLMGLLDRGTMTMDGEEVDLSHMVVFMTSNLGATGIMQILNNAKNKLNDEVRRKMHKAALDAATERFTPEFFNRLDEIIVFNPLLKDALFKIVGLEVAGIEQRLVSRNIRLHCTDLATEVLLKEGTDVRYGARHLRRTIERMIVQPLAHMITAGVLEGPARVKIIAKGGTLAFRKVED